MNRKSDDLIIALLAHETIAAAAKAGDIGEKTAFRWLQDANFQRRYREARRRVVEQALTTLQATTTGEKFQSKLVKPFRKISLTV